MSLSQQSSKFYNNQGFMPRKEPDPSKIYRQFLAVSCDHPHDVVIASRSTKPPEKIIKGCVPPQFKFILRGGFLPACGLVGIAAALMIRRSDWLVMQVARQTSMPVSPVIGGNGFARTCDQLSRLWTAIRPHKQR